VTNSGSLVVEVRNLHKVFGTSNTRTLKVIPAICRAAACRLKPSSSSNWSLPVHFGKLLWWIGFDPLIG
jgi:hypothetical protein